MMRLRHLLVAGTALVASTGAYAQTTPEPAPAAPSAQTDEIADIVVTAQRREQSAQDVPIAISVVSGDALQRTNATSLSDIQYFAPSVSYTAGQQNSFRVRGVGSQSFDYAVESSVGLVLDDVVQTLPRAPVVNTLFDVDRIEVLRGPQGTTFGKNTSAGLISITTKRPVIGETSLTEHLQYGSRDQVQAFAAANLPISDTMAIRLRGAVQRSNNVYVNRGPGEIENQLDLALNAKLLWKPTDALTLYFIGDYQDSRGDPGLAAARRYGAGTLAPAAGNTFIARLGTAAGIVPSSDNRDVNLDADNFVTTRLKGGQLTATYSLGAADLTSVTAYRELHYRANLEADSAPIPVLNDNLSDINSRQVTQELRIANAAPGTVEYVAGLFYYNLRTDATQVQQGTLGFIPVTAPFRIGTVGGLANNSVRTESYAAFADLTIRPIEPLRLLIGGRYTRDDVRSSIFVSPIAGVCSTTILLGGPCNPTPLPSPVVGGQKKRGDWSGRAGLQYDIAPRVMAYATVSRGYKSATIAVVSGQAFDIDAETVVSAEAGLKTQFFDRRVLFNIDYFHSDFDGFQTELFDPNLGVRGGFRTGNAGKLRAQGVEAELILRPATGLNLSGSVTYNDAKFRQYRPPCYPGQTAAQGCNLPGPSFDAAGQRLTNAPRWAYSINAAYERPVTADLSVFAAANYAYRSSVIYGVGDPGTIQGGFGLLDGSLGIGAPDGKLRVSVFARNLLDKRFAARIAPTIFDTGGYSQLLTDAAFRRIGVALDARF